MTRRETVISALNHEETPIVPYDVDFTIPQRQKMIKYLGDPDFESGIGGYVFGCEYHGWPTELADKPGYFIDDFGVVWNRSGADKDIGVIEDFAIAEPEISLIPKFTLNESRLRKDLEHVVENAGDRFTFGGIGFSLFERLWSLTGMENALVYMIKKPEFVNTLLDSICEINLRVIDIAGEYPLDAMRFGDDWGQQKGLIMGPPHWRKHLKPQLARMYERVHLQKRYVIQHSCGDISSIYGDLIEIGLDCHNTFQPEIYDIEQIKAEIGSRMSFWGGVSTQQLLPYATPEVVEMAIMSKGGGFIVSPTHSVPYDVPVENILAMMRVFQNQ
jgi:uroporphyrinogen decarboxylase